MHMKRRMILASALFGAVVGSGFGQGLLDEVEVHGFVDVRAGLRTQNDPNQKDLSLGEARFQLALERMWEQATITLRADLLYDDVTEEHEWDIEAGTGWLDLREASLSLYPAEVVELKLGRQILTWGTGDMLFINDLFPKDWQAFFSGRDVEYLKAPSDALLVSLFPEDIVDIYVVWTPRFDPDRYIRGERLSYWNPMLGAVAGQNAIIDPVLPDEWIEDDELAVRVARNIEGYDVSLYAYDGFWKNPEGMDAETGQAIFPRLAAYGASVNGNLMGGVVNAEYGYYDSRDDRDGIDPLLPNSEQRVLLGYEREIGTDLTLGVQYYLEYMQDYDGYLAGLPVGSPAAERDRHVVTARLTKMAMGQTLTLSLFAYYSPSDRDAYLRPSVKYKVSDAMLLTAGGNVFLGEEDYTFFGQFADNNNVYAGARYSF
jgi:hypothetical protein